jgi:hypothetical protein
VDLVRVNDKISSLAFAWDAPPPLRPEDEIYYRAVIRPSVIRRVAEYEERLGAALVVELA